MCILSSLQTPYYKPTKFFVQNIPHTVSQEDISCYFSRFGEVVDVFVPLNRNEDEKGHRGIAYVKFRTGFNPLCLSQNIHRLHGCVLTVREATPR